MKSYKLLFTIIALSILPFSGNTQSKIDKAPKNWFNLDYSTDKVMGISTEKAYKLLNGRTSTPVIVAVIDGGVDINHEDLVDVLWVNPKETKNNNTDDDKNGYVDDKYGWNFIGNANGENVEYDNLEVTRLINQFEPKYLSVLPSTKLTAKERREFVEYQKMVSDYTDKMDQAQFGELNFTKLKENIDLILKSLNKTSETITKADFDHFDVSGDDQKLALKLAKKELDKNSFNKFYDNIKDASEYYTAQTQYHLNKDYNSREIVGDNYEDATELYYGNSDVKGPDASHGTHVAGIIAAKRNNGIGIDGVADNAKIMSIRVVPNGDERDKDVANGIRYAVDNGARVINMSFGKGYVYNKATVDEAIKYAMEKDVLLIHAAGNDGKNNDVSPNFPTKYFTDEQNAITGEANNWITVGATSWKLDSDLLADFSNYGYKSVDVFAPGVDIYSTVPENKYKSEQGTSMAAPVVAGLAAIIRSYYPELTAPEVKEIIMNSVTKVDQKVKINKNGSTKKVYLDEISVSGGIVNAYNAIIEADRFVANKK